MPPWRIWWGRVRWRWKAWQVVEHKKSNKFSFSRDCAPYLGKFRLIHCCDQHHEFVWQDSLAEHEILVFKSSWTEVDELVDWSAEVATRRMITCPKKHLQRFREGNQNYLPTDSLNTNFRNPSTSSRLDHSCLLAFVEYPISPTVYQSPCNVVVSVAYS